MTRMSMMSETLAETLHGTRAQGVVPIPPRRRFMAGLTVGAVALSVVLGAAAPARAEDNRDLVKALAAIAVIGVIAAEVGKDRDAQPVDHRRDDDWRDGRRPPHYQPPRHTPPRPEPQRGPRIPSVCAIEIEGPDRRDVVVYGERCLRDHGLDRLPGACAREVRFYGQRDRIFPETCLRESGFRTGRSQERVIERPD